MPKATVTQMPRQAAVYARVSTLDQIEGTSLEDQERRSRAFIESKGWKLASVFVDEGVSGATALEDRPEGGKLLAAIDAGEVDAVVTLKVDRLTRSLRHGSAVLSDWAQDRADGEPAVAFAAVVEAFDTSSPAGRMMLNLLMVFAEFERERIAERMADGRRGIVERSTNADGQATQWTGGTVPYGYTTDDKGTIIEHPEHADTVRRVFELRRTGLSTTKIAAKLNAEGHAPRPRGKTDDGKAIVNPFSGELVQKILEPTAGHYLGEGIERRLSKREAPVVFAAPAIVTPDAFMKAAKAAKRQNKVKNAGTKRVKYALAERISHVHADDSTFGMFGLSRARPDGEARWHRCSAARTPEGCEGFGEVNRQNMTSVNADLIEAGVLRVLYSQTEDDWKRFLAAKESHDRAEAGEIDLEAARARLTTLLRQRDGYSDQEAAKLITRETLIEKLAAIDARAEAITETIEVEEARVSGQEVAEVTVTKLLASVGGLAVEEFLSDGTRPVKATGGLRPVKVTGGLWPKGSVEAMLVAVRETLDTPPDRYGRSPMLPREVVDEAARLAQALDLHVYVVRGDEPRRPRFQIEAAADALTTPLQSTQFSEDKTPYKTNVGIQFRHEGGKDVHAPGFYIHLEPNQNFAGVGMWSPETAIARRVRQHIYEHPDQWKKATRADAFLDDWDLEPDEEDMLKRVPKDFDPDFEYADDLRMKSFIAGGRLSKKEVTASTFDEDIAQRFSTANGFTGFLTKAVGLAY